MIFVISHSEKFLFPFQSNASSPPMKNSAKLPQFYTPGMLPPPPPPPLARPVALIRTSDGQTTIVSSNASSTISEYNLSLCVCHMFY
jgi:hypothetical protein